MEICSRAQTLLENYSLCDYCLGRQFSMLGSGLTNEERGEAIKLLLVLEGSRLLFEKGEEGKELLETLAMKGFSEDSFNTLAKVSRVDDRPDSTCYLCNNVFSQLDNIVGVAMTKLANYEYSTFLVGIIVEAPIIEQEDELRAKFQLKWGESIRNELSREIGKRIMEASGKLVSFKRPDILVTINPFQQKVTLKSNSLFILGRYKKLVRGIPQAKWICSQCKGKGCEKCQGEGKFYSDSVEELIAKPILLVTQGSDVKIHAAGREDVDVRVLGSGRPFIIEILDPVKRTIDLDSIETQINRTSLGKIEVQGLQYSSKAMVRKLKLFSGKEKVYRSLVEFDEKVTDEALERLKTHVENSVIQQQTPRRVMHRRALRRRKRRIHKIHYKRLKPNLVEMFIKCEGGLYIKEFINGDAGRTSPSVTEIIQVPAKVVELDVINVIMDGII